MTILTTPERLAKMLIDAHSSIVAAYHYTQDSIDQLERPCWLVFVEASSYPNVTANQELVEQSYSLAYVGQVFASGAGIYGSYDSEYEKLARQVAVSTIKYLYEHPQCQMTNDRGAFAAALPSLDTVMQLKVDGRSGVTLFSRDAVEGEAFWGFTIDVTVTEQMVYEMRG